MDRSTSPTTTHSLGHRDTPTLDDNHHRRGCAHWRCLEHKHRIKFLGMRCHSRKLLVVSMAQGCHMVTHHQDKFITKFGQCATLHATAGTAQQSKRILKRALIGVFGPFLRSHAHRPMWFRFQFNIQQRIFGALSLSMRTASRERQPSAMAVCPQKAGSRLWTSSGTTLSNPHPS